MVTVIYWAAGSAGAFLLFVVIMQIGFSKMHPEHVVDVAEEARYELHPTLVPGTLAITTANVNDIINDSIETGLEHPALTRRKLG